MKISAIDQDLLTLLQGKELYGLEIVEKINFNRPVQLTYGSVYPALKRLLQKKLVRDRWGDDSSVGARRKYYRLTALGVRKLKEVQRYRKQLQSL